MSGVLEHAVEEDDNKQRGKYLTFKIDSDIMAIEISYVTEIINVQPITALPEAPAYVMGVISLRGKIIPVIDMHLKLSRQLQDYTDRTCIIVVEVDGFKAGLIVDHVTEVIDINDKNIDPPPEIHSKSSSFLKGIGKSEDSIILILNCENLVRSEEIEDINSLMTKEK